MSPVWVGHTIPSFALATIKYDEHGRPQRAKYSICVLDNLNPHDWTKQQCYAPVMSHLEFCLLCALAVHHKSTLKGGDFKQAF
eukprot:8823999-Ditylum_brightwellii.AAC.2